MTEADPDNPHPVASLIATRKASGSSPGSRDDDSRLALVIEGGGMRGSISGGMILALEDAGLLSAFDDVYGASAGTLNGAWFVGGAARQGLPAWTDPVMRSAAIRKRNLLRGRPFVDGDYLTNVVYERLTPMPFDRVIGSDVKLHPMATDAFTGESVDLAPHVNDVTSLKMALRASTCLPLMSGKPVGFGGSRWFDAGLSESLPFRTAVTQGATHVLILRSRRRDEQESSEGGRTANLIARYLSRYSDELAAAFLARPSRLVEDDDLLDELQAPGSGEFEVMSLRPAIGTPTISRLERDDARILAGLEAGQAAVRKGLVAASTG